MVRKLEIMLMTVTKQSFYPTPKRVDNIPGPKQGHWTYANYATLPEDGNRYDLVDGVLYMAPAPNLWHQKITFEIASYMRTHVSLAGLGEVFIPPTDIQLASNTVFQPDVIVILKDHFDLIQESRIIGAPDLIVEVTSPGTATYDRRQKYDAYARAGVAEYWLVDPATQTVEVLTLEGGEYQQIGVFANERTITSKIIPTMQDVQVKVFFQKAW